MSDPLIIAAVALGSFLTFPGVVWILFKRLAVSRWLALSAGAIAMTLGAWLLSVSTWGSADWTDGYRFLALMGGATWGGVAVILVRAIGARHGTGTGAQS